MAAILFFKGGDLGGRECVVDFTKIDAQGWGHAVIDHA